MGSFLCNSLEMEVCVSFFADFIFLMSSFTGLAPFLHILANSSVIKDLAWCRECPDFLVTGKL